MHSKVVTANPAPVTTSKDVPSLPLVTLPYEIYDYSSAASTYFPHHIVHDQPNDQGSRWTTTESDQSQFLTVKLQKRAIVLQLIFGKFQKPHVCNLKEFRVFAGLAPDSMIEIFHGGLENIPGHESIAVKFQSESQTVFPVEYLKIVPHASFEKEFPYSIWFLELKGILDDAVVESFYQDFVKSRETQFISHCLKFLRQKSFKTTFKALTAEANIQLEDPLLSQMYDILVNQGDFDSAEQMLEKLATNEEASYFALQNLANAGPNGTHGTNASGWIPRWREIQGLDAYGSAPTKRGGHQLCADPEKGQLILFGGWDGTKNLNDLWVFDLAAGAWRCVAADTEYEMHGPTPRSCHKMCFDPARRTVYLLGEFLDHEARLAGIQSDFWAYHVDTQVWTRLSHNTAGEQGPALIYDHQMCIDSEQQRIYVFGGRVVTQDHNVHLYSGLFEYSILDRTWRNLRPDSMYQDLAPRVGHFMLFYPPTRQLLIYGGQKNKEVYHHFLSFDLATETITKLPVPEFNDPDLTQRAVYDPTLKAVLVLSSILSKPHASSHVPYISMYRMEQRTWHKCAVATSIQPCARFAHQLAYDPLRKAIFLLGGNPDVKEHTQLRLNDFWELSLQRPDRQTLLRQCLFLIRRQKFLKLCEYNKEQALFYLQHQVSAVVDHQHTEHVRSFASLTMHLFHLDPQCADTLATRNALFDQLASFFPSSMQQPSGNLLDLLPFI